jgi:hypothetical protein
VSFAELSEPLCHGSDKAVRVIDLSKGAPKKDFGQGFYTTNDRVQAEKFARLKAGRSRVGKGCVSIFGFKNEEGLSIHKFLTSDEAWFDFVLQNRGYSDFVSEDRRNQYDIVIGPVADVAVGVVLNLFVAGAYGDPKITEAKETAVRLLLAQRLHNQIFFGTELAVSRLSFMDAYDVFLD